MISARPRGYISMKFFATGGPRLAACWVMHQHAHLCDSRMFRCAKRARSRPSGGGCSLVVLRGGSRSSSSLLEGSPLAEGGRERSPHPLCCFCALSSAGAGAHAATRALLAHPLLFSLVASSSLAASSLPPPLLHSSLCACRASILDLAPLPAPLR